MILKKMKWLHTDAVITDCILGNGEALDCYNQKLQDANSMKMGLENMKALQAIALIESMNTADEKVSAYNNYLVHAVAI
jgi:hypothetical protein